MSDKDRSQINIRFTPGQMEQLKVLAVHYGSISAVVRVALDDLWDKRIRNQNVIDTQQDTLSPTPPESE